MKLALKREFFYKIGSEEEFFIGMNIPQKATLLTPESDLNGKEFASCIAYVRDQGERCVD